jgi:hypothetical protein
MLDRAVLRIDGLPGPHRLALRSLDGRFRGVQFHSGTTELDNHSSGRSERTHIVAADARPLGDRASRTKPNDRCWSYRARRRLRRNPMAANEGRSVEMGRF